MNPLEIEYALAKQVPDMARGFRISTSYGDIAIEPGWVASIVITHLERALRCELRELNAPTPDATDQHGVSLESSVIGEGDRALALVVAGQRSNGKHLITPARARSLIEQMGHPLAKDLPALPREPILGTGYVHRPAPAPFEPGSCALCLVCPHRLAAQATCATGEKG